MKIIFKANYNTEKFPVILHENNLPSETVPGMSMTINEIIARCASGMKPAIERKTSYDGLAEDLGFGQVDPTLDPDFDLPTADQMQREIELRKVPVTQEVTDQTEAVAE